MPAGARHVPVLLPRVAELLRPALAAGPAVLVDATLGLGGHAVALLAEHPRLTLVGLDRDPDALALAGRRLAAFADRAHLVHAVYDQLAEVLAGLGLREVQGVLFDLGVSSLQLDTSDRGFSYARDAELDMRMDPASGRTAAEVLNTYPVAELARILREYGEERFARRIAAAVVRRREQAPLTRSAELVELLYDAVPAASRRTGGHPAKRTFQALRIEVNGELDALRTALPAALDALARRGPDRRARLPLARGPDRQAGAGRAGELADARSTCRSSCPGTGRSCGCSPAVPSGRPPEEIDDNPRAASVRLRAAMRIGGEAA